MTSKSNVVKADTQRLAPRMNAGARGQWIGAIVQRVGAEEVGDIVATLMDLARGRAVPLRDANGEQVRLPVMRKNSKGKMVQRIEGALIIPRACDVINAAEELLNRMFGRPPHTLALADATGEEAADRRSALSAELLAEATPEEIEVLRKMAQRAARVRREIETNATSEIPVADEIVREARAHVAHNPPTPQDFGLEFEQEPAREIEVEGFDA